MALIKCKGCGNMVSSRAESCPKCGFSVRLSMEQQEEANQPVTPPVASNTVEQQEEENQPVTPPLDEESGRISKKGLMAVIVAVVIIVCGGIGFGLYNSNLGEQTTIEITPELTEAVQKYDSLGQFHEGLACVKKDGKYGYIDGKENEVVPCRYDGAHNFSEGLAWIRKGDLCGFINKNGEEVIPCRYDDVCFFLEGLAVVVKGNKWDYVDKKGNSTFSQVEDEITDNDESIVNSQCTTCLGQRRNSEGLKMVKSIRYLSEHDQTRGKEVIYTFEYDENDKYAYTD